MTGVLAALGIGIAASFGLTVGLGTMVLMPALAMIQARRRTTWLVAFSYYAAASWAIIPAARNFFGPGASVPEGLMLWLGAALLLSTPWLALWSADHRQLLWRIPLALTATAIPPLGIIGWASPLCSAGILFPAAAWAGLAATTLVPAAIVRSPRRTVFITAVASLVLNMSIPDPPAPSNWEAVNTQFGNIAHGNRSMTKEFEVLSWLGSRALESDARVVVFPEAVVPMWTEATDFFWDRTINQLRKTGKIVIIGAGLPVGPGGSKLQGYRNGAIIRGSEAGFVQQRIPVPLGMWHPVGPGGVPLRMDGSGVAQIGGERVAVLICYEQLLVWPMIRSLLDHPTILIGIANDHWAAGTPVQTCQARIIAAWSRLLHIPVLSATNN